MNKEDFNMNHLEFQDGVPPQNSITMVNNCVTPTGTSYSPGHVNNSIITVLTSSTPTPTPPSTLTLVTRGGIPGVPGGPGRRRGPNMQAKSPARRCFEFICSPRTLFLVVTILLTGLASFLLSYSLTSTYWEMMTHDPEKIQEIIERNESLYSHITVEWLFEGRVPKIIYDNKSPSNSVLYLLPIHSGVWISCIDITGDEYDQLIEMGYNKSYCVDHLDPNLARPTEARASWQHRMQNLAIACALVCLILLGAAVLVGLFGVLRPQISAVLVTGVIYMLAALFALFTLTIVHLKHKNRKEWEPLDVWTRLIQSSIVNGDFSTSRLIYHGWSLKLAWAGSFVCLLASVMWVLLSKIMRYNPNPLAF